MPMSPERWEQVQAVFHKAVELAEDKREAYLAEVAQADPSLAEEVRHMLQANASGSGFAEPPEPDSLHREMSPADYLQGTRLGDFELGHELGRGGMGIVYEARQISLDRQVAVKVLPPALAASPVRFERFRREAIAASKLNHPGLAPPILFDQADGIVYYAMKLAEGPAVDALLRAKKASADTGPLPQTPEAIASLVRALLETLEHVHENGLVHRDVKPGNVILSAEGPVLIDFGLAKDFELEDLSRTGEPSGTPHYMSPEQVRAEKNKIDLRTDIYSAGAVLFELLTGKPPFTGKGAIEVFKKITDERPARMPNTPRPLELICQKALSKDPADRYQTAAAMAADLERYLNGQQVEARPPSLAKEAQRFFKKRRAVVLGMPIVILAAIFTRQLWPVQAAALSEVTFDLSKTEVQTGVQVQAWRYLDGFGGESEAGEWIPLDGIKGALELRSGMYRFELRSPDGQLAELIDELSPGESARLTPRAFRTPLTNEVELPPEMATVPAGRLVMSPVGPAVNTSDGLHEMQVGTFAVDRATVTNGELRQVFKAADLWPPFGMTTKQAARWDDPPRGDWDDLPATGLSMKAMRTFAGLRGKRLLTLAEWGRMVDMSIDNVTAETSNLSSGNKQDIAAETTHLQYLERVMPTTSSAPTTAPLGLVFPLSNVRCSVESHFALPIAVPAMASEGMVANDSYGLNMGGYWHDRLGWVLERPKHIGAVMSYGYPGPEVGFRCAITIH